MKDGRAGSIPQVDQQPEEAGKSSLIGCRLPQLNQLSGVSWQ